jgi:hypothetical protein
VFQSHRLSEKQEVGPIATSCLAVVVTKAEAVGEGGSPNCAEQKTIRLPRLPREIHESERGPYFTGVNPACPVGAKHRTGV